MIFISWHSFWKIYKEAPNGWGHCHSGRKPVSPSPFQGEGWDGGAIFTIQSPPLPSPFQGEGVNWMPVVFLKTCQLSFILVMVLFSVSAMVQAADVPFEFKTPEQEQRYKDLTEQLRCLVCQNQSLADSHAELAQDLRNEVYRMIVQGQSDKEIVDFLVTRYGDYVLFRPPLKTGTVLLWAGPFLMLIGALLIVFRYTQKNRRQTTPELNSADQQKLDALLQRPAERERR